MKLIESVDWASVPPEAMEAGFAAFQDGMANGMSPGDAFEAAGAAADPYMPADMGDMTADMMSSMPADAMGGMTADMMEAMPADAMGGMDAGMMANMPAGAMGGMDADMMSSYAS